MTGLIRAPRRDVLSAADFGIFPDGITNWEATNPGGRWAALLLAATTKTVLFPPGYYATGINLDSSYSGAHFHFEDGAMLGGVFHLISDAAPSFVGITTIARAANVVTVATQAPHGWATGKRVRIKGVHVTGVGSVDFNGDDFTITVTGASAFTYPQVGQNEAGSVAYGAALVCDRPISGVIVTGRLTTSDRLGSINAKDCYIERAWVKSDPTKHSGYPGTTCRGAHLYWGTDGLTIGELVIDDASGANTDAALAIDGNGHNPTGIHIGRCHIKDSDYHGAYITGGGHTFGELRIDAFARGVYIGTLQDSGGSAPSAEVKGLWLQRCWDTHIAVLRTSQNLAGSRGGETKQVLFGETGSGYFGKDRHGITVGTWFARNVRRQGLLIGDAGFDSVRTNVSIDTAEIRLAPAGLDAGTYALRCNGASAGSRVAIGTLRCIDFGANHALYIETTADVHIDRFEATSHTERLIYARGRVVVDDLHAINAGTNSANAMIHFANQSVLGSRLGNVHLEAAGAVQTRIFQADAACNYWSIGKLASSNYHLAGGTVYLDACSGWQIEALHLVGPSSANVGVRFNGAIVDGYMGPGTVQGFAKGFEKGAATFTRLTAVGLNGNGNTTPTDLANGSAAMLGCNGVTL